MPSTDTTSTGLAPLPPKIHSSLVAILRAELPKAAERLKDRAAAEASTSRPGSTHPTPTGPGRTTGHESARAA